MGRRTACLLFLVFLAACGGTEDGENAGPLASPSPDAGETGGATTLGCRAKGFNYVCWYRDCFQESETAGSLDVVKGLGSNWLEIVPTWYQDTLNSETISEHPSKSPTDEDLRYVIPLVREKGFQIALKPHVDILGGGWRGQIDPDDLTAWQASYEDFILHFASLAQELGVEVFSIGTELKTRSGDVSFWRGLIPKIRERYTGFLTYSANWDEYDNVPFWDLLDFVGIDFYFPLTDDPDATQTAMEEGLSPIRDTLKSFSIAKNRPFLFTEIGYRSVDGMNLVPYDYQISGAIDLQEQADAYNAVLSIFSESESWLEGIFWWDLGPILEGGSSDDGYSPYDKPAADVLKTFWGGDTCSAG